MWIEWMTMHGPHDLNAFTLCGIANSYPNDLLHKTFTNAS